MSRFRDFLKWEKIEKLDIGMAERGICITGYVVSPGIVVAPNPFDDERGAAANADLRRGVFKSTILIYITNEEFEKDANWLSFINWNQRNTMFVIS